MSLVPQFREGDTVTYYDPGHIFHMRQLVLKKINPAMYDPKTGAYTKMGYFLETIDGVVQIVAESHQILPGPILSGGLMNVPVKVEATINPHAGHEIIENYAGGKAFKYCRDCKEEVL